MQALSIAILSILELTKRVLIKTIRQHCCNLKKGMASKMFLQRLEMIILKVDGLYL